MRRMRHATWVAAAALALLAGDASLAAEPVHFRQPLTDKPVVKPKRIEFNDLLLKRIKWTGWGERRATGTARASINLCIPNCASSGREKGTATLKMFHRHREAAGRFYGCMTGRVKAAGQTTRVEWPPACDR